MTIIVRKPGRPKKYGRRMQQVSVTLDEDSLETLANIGPTVSAAIRRMVRREAGTHKKTVCMRGRR